MLLADAARVTACKRVLLDKLDKSNYKYDGSTESLENIVKELEKNEKNLNGSDMCLLSALRIYCTATKEEKNTDAFRCAFEIISRMLV